MIVVKTLISLPNRFEFSPAPAAKVPFLFRMALFFSFLGPGILIIAIWIKYRCLVLEFCSLTKQGYRN